VTKHNRHLRTRGICKKNELQVRVFYISQVFSNVQSVLSQCNTRLRLLYLLDDIEVMWQKTGRAPLLLGKTKIAEGIKAGRASKKKLGPSPSPLESRSGSYLYFTIS